jgi:hypothetical protein
VTVVAGRISSERSAEPYVQCFLERLEGLAAELAKHGLMTRLKAPRGRVPSLHVINPAQSMLAEHVYVGRSQDGLWWFWWPWAERIAPGDEHGVAASVIARVLSALD